MTAVTHQSRDEMQNHSGILHPLSYVIGYRTCIAHNLYRVFKNILVDFLQNIFFTAVGSNLESIVNMPVTKIQTGNRLSLSSEGIRRFLYILIFLLITTCITVRFRFFKLRLVEIFFFAKYTDLYLNNNFI